MPSGRLAGSRAPRASASRSMPRSVPRDREAAVGEHDLASGSPAADAAAMARPFSMTICRPPAQRRAAHMHRARAAMAVAGAHRLACRPARSGTPRSAGRAGRRRSADSRSRGPGRSTACRAAASTVPSAVEADLGAFVRRAARGFEEAGDAEAAQPAARGRLGAPRREAGAVAQRRAVVEIGGEAAAVDRRCRAPLR